jgi:hypothetical protein
MANNMSKAQETAVKDVASKTQEKPEAPLQQAPNEKNDDSGFQG